MWPGHCVSTNSQNRKRSICTWKIRRSRFIFLRVGLHLLVTANHWSLSLVRSRRYRRQTAITLKSGHLKIGSISGSILQYMVWVEVQIRDFVENVFGANRHLYHFFCRSYVAEMITVIYHLFLCCGSDKCKSWPVATNDAACLSPRHGYILHPSMERRGMHVQESYVHDAWSSSEFFMKGSPQKTRTPLLEKSRIGKWWIPPPRNLSKRTKLI